MQTGGYKRRKKEWKMAHLEKTRDIQLEWHSRTAKNIKKFKLGEGKLRRQA